MIGRIEVNMTNGSVHNFRRGEFGVKEIDIDEKRALIEITYNKKEIGEKRVFIPFHNIEKCEYLEKTSVNGDKG